MVFWYAARSWVGLARNFWRKLCMPFAPAKSARVSRSRNWVIRVALLTISTAFFWRSLYVLVSASLAVGIAPGWFLNMISWVEPLAKNSRYALAASVSAARFGDLDAIWKVSI